MTSEYRAALRSLNDAQRRAVELIDGPLMVIAGPGTGKTQLLSTRVAYILENSDTAPENILCLTFTDSAAQEMRDRLHSIIGEAANKVRITTYHSFGSELLMAYPEYFERRSLTYAEDSRLERPIDDITRYSIVQDILKQRDRTDSLAGAVHYVRDVIATLSECKRALIGPEQLRQIATENRQTITILSEQITDTWQNITLVPRTFKSAEPLYCALLDVIKQESSSLAQLAADQLERALIAAQADNRSTPLTAWKNDWLIRHAEGWNFTDSYTCDKLDSLAEVMEQYLSRLASRGLYDFDDMILQAIGGLRAHDALRLTLQEKYLYILLDEFQDTNAAQFEIVKLITDSPIHEGRPNIMAVGDDDQAIYAFQGAELSNMSAFLHTYRDVTVISLEKNYRSHQDIVQLSTTVAQNIRQRLHHSIPGLDKKLRAVSQTLPETAHLYQHTEQTKAGEYEWVAGRIAELQAKGEPLSEIAVLAPKHKYLEELVPYLNSLDIPVWYEKRENILTTPIVTSLRQTSELLIALSRHDMTASQFLMPIVLSLPYWRIPPEVIWAVNWQSAKRDETRTWTELALQLPKLRSNVQLLMALASLVEHEPLEKILDLLCGTDTLSGHISSPLKSYYFEDDTNEQVYYETITHLTVIREKLREMQLGHDMQLRLKDFIQLFSLYENAEQSLINIHPVKQADDAVQLMTVYKAKGREFNHVFVLSALDTIWGPSTRGSHNKLTLPKNLSYIRFQKSDDDELLRIFFVALTRARYGLYITRHRIADNGKKLSPLSLISIDDSIPAYPEPADEIEIASPPTAPALSSLLHLWQPAHTALNAPLKQMLQLHIEKYRLSPTHVNTFIDLEWGGPDAFLLNTLLRFPQAPTLSGEYGNAIHESLEWYQQQLKHGRPNINALIEFYTACISKRYISAEELSRTIDRGERALRAYIAERGETINVDDISEYDFRSEPIFVEGVPMTGKIDRLIVNKKKKEVIVIDYKTGEPFDSWKPLTLKALKYRQQLYLYKLLVEHSSHWHGYAVVAGRLEFVEPDKRSGNVTYLDLAYDDQELAAIIQLVKIMYQHVQTLDFPDVAGYSKDLSGAQQFIQDLLAK